MDLSVVPYTAKREEAAVEVAGCEGSGGLYRECLRNHAAAMGGQAYDGCGEFMPGGEAGSPEALKCAACGCHRSFHRRDGDLRPVFLYCPAAAARKHGERRLPPLQHPAFLPPPLPLPLPYHPMQPPPLAVAPPPAPDRSCRVGSETPPRRESPGEAAGSRKRVRTKFTAEQKEKMQAFAEKLGWRIQKHDDVALDEFCLQIGVKRHVLKVWMHNNKNHLSSTAAVAVASAGAASHPATDTTSSSPIRV